MFSFFQIKKSDKIQIELFLVNRSKKRKYNLLNIKIHTTEKLKIKKQSDKIENFQYLILILFTVINL